jgi:hypothetical protein
MRKITPTLFILLRNKVTLTLLAVIVAVSLYGWRSARDTYQLITGKEKDRVHGRGVNAGDGVRPSKISGKVGFCEDQHYQGRTR